MFGYGFGYETGDDIAQNRVNVFREAYPDVDISFSESGSEAQGLLAALASDDPPDMVYLSRNEAGSYIARGALMPLDDCLAANGVDLANYYDAGLAQGTVDGSLYAMPEFFNTRVWILNNHVFDEAGIDPTTVDLSDWEGLVELNEQLTTTDGGDVTRIGLDPKLPEFLPLWSWANGAPMISEDGLTAQLDDPGVVEAVEAGGTVPRAVRRVHRLPGFQEHLRRVRCREPVRHRPDRWDVVGAVVPQRARRELARTSTSPCARSRHQRVSRSRGPTATPGRSRRTRRTPTRPAPSSPR